MNMNFLKPVYMEGESGAGAGGGAGGGGGGGGGGGADDNWRTALGEEMAGSEAFANFNDVAALGKSYVELKSMQGSSIRIPGEDAGEDAVKAFNEKLLSKVPGVMLKPNFDDETQSTDFFRSIGMPENSDGYELPKIEIPEGVSMDDERLAGLREVAHKHKLSTKQFNGFMADVLQLDIDEQVSGINEGKEAQKELKTEWGLAYDDNMKSAMNVARVTKAPEALLSALEEGKLGPDTAKWLHSMANSFKGEGSQFSNDDGGSNAVMTPAEAKEKISEMMNNQKHPYWLSHNPGHQDAVNRMVELQKYANPSATSKMERAGFSI